MARKFKIHVTTVVVIAILCPTALGRISEEKESDTKWATAVKQGITVKYLLPILSSYQLRR